MATGNRYRPADASALAPPTEDRARRPVAVRRVLGIARRGGEVQPAPARVSREDDDDPEAETSRFEAKELGALLASSTREGEASPPSAPGGGAVAGGVERPTRSSEPSSGVRGAPGFALLSKPSPVLLIPERLTRPPAPPTRVDPAPPVPAPSASAPAAPVAPRAPSPPPAPRAPEARPIAKARFDWRESNLARKPAAFELAHGLLELLAIVVGFAVTTLCLMACAGAIVDRLALRTGLAVVIALALPAIVARRLRPKDDPLIAIGLTTETYALLLLGFAVAFVIVGHAHTASLLAAEGDRAARAGVRLLARAEWFLARVEPR